MMKHVEMVIKIEAITLLCDTCERIIVTVRGGTLEEAQAACEAAVAAHKKAKPEQEHKISGKIEGVA